MITYGLKKCQVITYLCKDVANYFDSREFVIDRKVIWGTDPEDGTWFISQENLSDSGIFFGPPVYYLHP